MISYTTCSCLRGLRRSTKACFDTLDIVRERDFGLHQESFHLKCLEGRRILYIEKKEKEGLFLECRDT